MTVFNIGSQNAANVNNVGGDQYITGGQHGLVVPLAVQEAVGHLRAGVRRLPLPAVDAALAEAAVDEVDRQLRQPAPDRSAVARSLGRLTELCRRTGALVTAGATLVAPLRTIAQWLGAVGAPVITAVTGGG